MKELIIFLCGASIGALIMGLMSVRSYDKGYKDGIQEDNKKDSESE